MRSRSLVVLFPLALAACPSPSDKPDDTDTDTDTVDSEPVDTEVDTDTDVEVPNRAPSAPEVELGPVDPTIATGIEATLTADAVDPDGDEVTYLWTWTVDGIVRGDLDGPTIAPGVPRKGEQWEVSVRASDGLQTSEPATAAIRVGNAEPSLSISWYEASPDADDDLQVRVVAVDADNEPLAITYTWTKDAVATTFGTAVIPAYYTDVGQQWEVTVTVADGSGVEATDSLAVTVGNRAPVISSVTLTPSPASPGGAITATAVASDADRDPLTTTWSWTRNGASTPYTTSALPPGVTAAGENWAATARVADDHGGVATKTTSVQVVNQAPVAEVDILPGDPSPGEALEAVVDAADVDGDSLAITYAWKLDGVATARTTAIVPAGVTQHGQVWEVTASVNDGHGHTTVVTAEVEVVDQAPIVWSADIDPLFPTDADDLVVDVLATDAEGQAITLIYQWTRDGQIVPSITGDTVPAALTAVGETWFVRVTAFDGRSYSGQLTSTPVYVR